MNEAQVYIFLSNSAKAVRIVERTLLCWNWVAFMNDIVGNS